MEAHLSVQSLKGSLVIGGVGILLAGHCTLEALNAIKHADIVFSVMGDELMQQWLEDLNPNTESLQYLYKTSHSRPEAYRAMVDKILAAVRQGLHVCVVFYGHPGVFVTPSHAAIKLARAEGYEALMLPGVSAEDCLTADLGVDPGRFGCQSYEAHHFVTTMPAIETRAALILWQIAVVGDASFTRFDACPEALETLSSVLQAHYPADHLVTVYAAATLPTMAPEIEVVKLADLAGVSVSQASTLYVPPLRKQGRPERAEPF
jgi:precorrin-2 methylase